MGEPKSGSATLLQAANAAKQFLPWVKFFSLRRVSRHEYD